MAEYEANANEATGFSGFGGHLLTQIYAEGSEQVSTLASLGIKDVEQLAAVAAIPQVSSELESVLGLDSENFQWLIDQCHEALPEQRWALVSSPAPTAHGLGVLPPTTEMIAAAEASAVERAGEAEAAALPAAVNLIATPYMPDIQSQGARGTCVSFTMTALNEYVQRRGGNWEDLSEQHLYYEIKQIDGDPDCGTRLSHAANVLRDLGQCQEHLWPYNPDSGCNDHGARPVLAQPDGLAHRLASPLGMSPRDVLAYKAHLSQQRPVAVAFDTYDSWKGSAETERSGRITMRVGNEPDTGGHAVLLVGYQDTPDSPGGGFFIVRNSWGTSWANESPYGAGYGTVPYEYITNEGHGTAYTAMLPIKNGKENKDVKEGKDNKDAKNESKEGKDGKDNADSKGRKDGKDGKDNKDSPDKLEEDHGGKLPEAPPPPGLQRKYQEYSAFYGQPSLPSSELLGRIGAIERRLSAVETEVAQGRTFIRQEERPTVGEQTVADPDEEEG
jgi:C1A family cysteine protease